MSTSRRSPLVGVVAVVDDVEPGRVITIDAVDLVRLTEVLGTQRPPDISDPDAIVAPVAP